MSKTKNNSNHNYMQKISNIYQYITNFLENYFLQFYMLFIRIWMAKIFWYSALTKISSWQSTLFLFENVYKVPMISPDIAAYLATTFELSCSVLLAFGLLSRIATLPLLVMTAVIQFTYLKLIDHSYWAMLLSMIFFYGPGKISIDYFIKKKLKS
jgi:putative oxidoreductase